MPVDNAVSGTLSDAVENLLGTREPNRGLAFAGAMRGTDANRAEAIQPGYAQDFFTIWALPEGVEMTPTVTVRINALKERRSTLDDTKIWADPTSLASIDLTASPVQGIQ